jgi:hypothetical protein
MTKVVTMKKKPTAWQEIAIMLEAFITNLISEDSDLSEHIDDAVLIYKLKNGAVVFESTGSTDVNKIGMMCSAVHIACVYEGSGEPIH